MAHKSDQAPENYFNQTDPAALERAAGDLATHRLGELESGEPLASFTADDLSEVHRYLLQDIYPWGGDLRTEEVGAMGMPMCRAAYVPDMLSTVMKNIDKNPPSRTNMDEAIATVADHWGELTIVHPFRDGNSRTQRYFFDQMMRDAGWSIDWTAVNANEVHAARYIAAATTDSRFLADALRPGVTTIDEGVDGTLQKTQGIRDNATSAELFHQMSQFRVEHPGQSFHDQHITVTTPPPGYEVMSAPNATPRVGTGITDGTTMPDINNTISKTNDAGLGD